MDTNWLIQYPVWELTSAGGGFLIALIAVLHVYVAHFAVGGGLFLVLSEIKGYREDSPKIIEYVKKHTKFFMLLTLVFGGLSGVGIWLVISILSPQAVSLLIHQFVFGWATEWTFFIGEIVAILVYYYTFGKMDKKNHLTVGWLYFIFGWLSLFVINGIVCFMLTPGDWLQTGNFWDGLFNPTFFPSLFFRIFISLMLAGLFGFITAAFIKDDDFRDRMMRYCAWWLLIPFVFALLSGYWYIQSLPMAQKSMILERSPEIAPMLSLYFWVSAILFVGGIIMALKLPGNIKKAVAFGLLVIGLVYLGSFEWIREAGRRPYLIYGYMYSNGALAQSNESDQGVLERIRWAGMKQIDDSNRMEAGNKLFQFFCASCHSIKGPVNDIVSLTQKYTVFGMEAQLDGMGKINDYMPVFPGNAVEKNALAVFIVEGLNNKTDKKPEAVSVKPLPVEIPSFDTEKDEYVLLAWSGKGMRYVTDNNRWFCLSPPANDFYAMPVKRGETPEHVTDGVTLRYAIEKGYETPSENVDFWTYSSSLVGKEIQKDAGIGGKQTSGEMVLDDVNMRFAAVGVPVSPYKNENGKNIFQPVPSDGNSGGRQRNGKRACPNENNDACFHGNVL